MAKAKTTLNGFRAVKLDVAQSCAVGDPNVQYKQIPQGFHMSRREARKEVTQIIKKGKGEVAAILRPETIEVELPGAVELPGTEPETEQPPAPPATEPNVTPANGGKK